MSYVLVDNVAGGNECGKQGVALASYQHVTVHNSVMKNAGYSTALLIAKGIANTG
jgi:hypothetical protein